MSKNQSDVPSLLFERADNGVYFTEIRPTPKTLGVLIELKRTEDIWAGTFLVFHASPRCACQHGRQCKACSPSDASATLLKPSPVTQDMVSAKITLQSPDFRELIEGMKNICATMPANEKFTTEERATLEVATEMRWQLPKAIIPEIGLVK